ncbi:piwi-like protein 1 isoform X2 [Scophthalmus maximus]|uniref:piwi-like protein 1 isoform X2 n=1 Tax=Scophthalmus maximus TaxID=52904 RepID=UPI001FA91832|nr:piwi-like protein 1 isoform X2 [Scophthalmus maximus]
MTGRARARARAVARGQETAAPGASKAREAAPATALVTEAELVGRGRQKGAPGAFSAEAVLQISAGFQKVKLGERGGRRQDFNDAGINTRHAMEHVKESKSGTSGSAIQLTANYFRIMSRPRWVLYQYHVDFNPPMESRRLRSALLFHHEETLGAARSFDGAMLFLPQRLHNKETVLHSETRNGEKVQITVTLTNELPPTSPMCIQFYNILFKRILRILNMQQIGRNYYNPKDSLSIPQHRLTIWPGYTTTILEYESAIMMCIDVSHKVLRSETVLDFMVNLKQQCGEQRFPEICTKELVGLIVLTKYNNKTYRIDDFAWDKTPCNTFTRGDEEVSFKNYFKKQYNQDIADDNQVLLVSHIKKMGPSGGHPGPALLVPELCYLTGLTDKMRKDFKIMKDLSEHTRLNPDQRQGRLNSFVTNIQRVEYQDHQESLLRALQQNVGPKTQMVVVVLPSNRKDKYDSIKKYLCVDCPTPSQCVLSRTLGRPQALMTVATKIALQMACKMGGELWSLEIPLKQLMIVGIDCYHDTIAGKRSIGALVASLNQSMSRWFSKCVLQHKGQEIIDGLKMALTAALKDYLKFNGCLPSRIIVYRDGVGDGQLHSVVNYEVAQIMDSIKSMGQDYLPKLSVVVVKKRISSRFFALLNGRMSNPPTGTIVDTDVTRPEWYDFYIVSQAVSCGSVAPTHYNVVYDTSGLKPDHMQRLTYKLCHMYYNWQGIIRVPAPCMYAHKLAFLVGQSIHREPNVQLDELLFYL